MGGICLDVLDGDAFRSIGTIGFRDRCATRKIGAVAASCDFTPCATKSALGLNDDGDVTARGITLERQSETMVSGWTRQGCLR